MMNPTIMLPGTLERFNGVVGSKQHSIWGFVDLPRFMAEAGRLGGVLAVVLDDGFAQMIGSVGLMVVGDEAAGRSGSVGGFVVPDRSGEDEESLADAGGDALGLLPAAAFDVELGFGGLVGRFDDLSEWSHEALQGPGLLSFDGESDEGDAGVGEFGVEPGGSVALGVLFGEVVLDDAGGCCPSERSVVSVVIVEVGESGMRVGVLVV